MFNFIKKKNSFQSKDESYKYIAGSLIDLSKETKNKVFSFTSSNSNPEFLLKIVRNLGKKMADKKVNTLIVRSYFNDNQESFMGIRDRQEFLTGMKLINISLEKFKEMILENSEKYDIILVSLPSVILSADALDYAKVCKEIIIAEKYTECYYSDYENTLETLKMAKVKASGVITVC